MTRITPEMIRLYDEYTHVTLDRRGFLARLTALAGTSAAAAAIVPLLEASPARAAMVPEGDSRLVTERIRWAGATGEMSGYLARPADAPGKLPAIMVIHENRGLNPHIEDVTRRAALEGFLALGVDFLSPLGGTPANEDTAREMIGRLDPAKAVADSVATVAFLKGHDRSTGEVGAVGFCWGGAMVNQTAIHAPDLAAAVAFYGRVPEPADVPKIEAKLMLHYAGLDERINAGVPAYEAALQQAGVDHRIYVYEGANHAFNNDTSAARYDKAAAELAWGRTMAFFKESLGS